jgi:hypothetical protein
MFSAPVWDFKLNTGIVFKKVQPFFDKLDEIRAQMFTVALMYAVGKSSD